MYTLRRVRSQAERIVIISATTTTASKLRERIIKAVTILHVAAYAAVSKPAARAIAVRRRWGLAVGEPHAIGNMGGDATPRRPSKPSSDYVRDGAFGADPSTRLPL